MYYNGEKLKQIEATKRRHTARAHIKSHRWKWQCYHANKVNPNIKLGAKLTGQQPIPRRRNAPPLHLTGRRCRMAKTTQTINILGINQPDKEVHFRYSESDHRHDIQQRYVAPKAHTDHKLFGYQSAGWRGPFRATTDTTFSKRYVAPN